MAERRRSGPTTRSRVSGRSSGPSSGDSPRNTSDTRWRSARAWPSSSAAARFLRPRVCRRSERSAKTVNEDPASGGPGRAVKVLIMGGYGASKLDTVSKVQLRSSGAVVAGGESGKFVPPYAIRTIFDEFSLDAPILRKGKIRFVPALSGLERSEFMPPVGVVEGYYTIHSELATMPKTIGKGVQEMDFIVAFPAAFRETIATLVRLGLASREEIVIEGTKVRPYDATATVIDALPKPKDPELDVDIQRCGLVRQEEGNPMA